MTSCKKNIINISWSKTWSTTVFLQVIFQKLSKTKIPLRSSFRYMELFYMQNPKSIDEDIFSNIAFMIYVIEWLLKLIEGVHTIKGFHVENRFRNSFLTLYKILK